MRDWQHILIRYALCLAIVFALVGSVYPAPAAAQGTNLLQNGGFEGSYVDIGGDPSLQVAPNWQPWSLPPPSGAPSSVNLRPDYQPAPNNRVRSGSAAQEYNTFFATHDGGVFQRVPVSAGVVVKFSAFVYVWSSATFENPDESIQPQDVDVRVGIDPTGGQDGDSVAVIWSTPVRFYDEYREISVTATASSNAVTVFVRTTPDGAVGVNNIYVDDASLIAVGVSDTPGGPSPTTEELGTPTTPTPTLTPLPGVPTATQIPVVPTNTPTPAITSTPVPTAVAEFPNRLIYTVQSGDTVLGIALTYQSTVDAIIAANGLDASGFILVGQQLVIPVPAGLGQPAVTATPVPPTATPLPTAVPTMSPTTDGGTPTNPPGTHVVQAGENLFRIALQYNTTIEALASLNNITNPNLIIAGTILRIPGADGAPTPDPGSGTPVNTPGTHIVQPGENAYRISLQYGITVEELAAANGLSNPNLIFVGQTLIIPQ